MAIFRAMTSFTLGRAAGVAFVTSLSCIPARTHAQSRASALRDSLQARIAQVPGAVVGLVFHDLASGALVKINADTLFHAASTMKVPVMIEYFRARDAGRVAPGQTVLLLNRFASIVDGSPYSLDAGEDSDSALYGMIGTRIPVSQLVDRMITRSSNLATNAVIALLGATATTETARHLGASTIRVLRGVEDGLAYQHGLNNVTSAADMAALLEAIETHRAASPASCNAMIQTLERQEFNDEIPAGLPKGTRVAHKTGWIAGVLHDAALVYPRGRAPYVLVVLTRGIPDDKLARALIADLSRIVWQALPGLR
ncbi:MAG: Beta-lactamase AST-1 [Gemmatimonadaceae bacterium]|nr:Beta-lactamase AST-1 [Gemmatimonadaceae bacterium]